MRSYDYKCECGEEMTNSEVFENYGCCTRCGKMLTLLGAWSSPTQKKYKCEKCKSLFGETSFVEDKGRCFLCGGILLPIENNDEEEGYDDEEKLMCSFGCGKPAVKIDDYGMGYCEACTHTIYPYINDALPYAIFILFKERTRNNSVFFTWNMFKKKYCVHAKVPTSMENEIILLDSGWTLQDMINFLHTKLEYETVKNILIKMSDYNPHFFNQLLNERMAL